MSLIAFKPSRTERASGPSWYNYRSEFDRLFDDLFTHLPAARASERSSVAEVRLDISETPKEVRVVAELPGMEEKDIDLEITRDVLTLRGEKRFEKEEKEHNYHLIERSYGNFARTVRLPFEPAADAVDASFKNGVLTVSIQKPQKTKPESNKIAVKSA